MQPCCKEFVFLCNTIVCLLHRLLANHVGFCHTSDVTINPTRHVILY